jgi:hypothetical protein
MASAIINLPGKEVLDPLDASHGFLVVVAFIHDSASREFQVVINLAEHAAKFCAVEIGAQEYLLVGFATTPDDAARAHAVIDIAKNWRGTMIFARGQLIKQNKALLDTLQCYVEASNCRDKRAHCVIVVVAPGAMSDGRISRFSKDGMMVEYETAIYEFPCKLLSQRFLIDPNHSSSYANQTQAAGVACGTSICPLFDPDAGRPCGTHTDKFHIDVDRHWHKPHYQFGIEAKDD